MKFKKLSEVSPLFWVAIFMLAWQIPLLLFYINLLYGENFNQFVMENELAECKVRCAVTLPDYEFMEFSDGTTMIFLTTQCMKNETTCNW